MLFHFRAELNFTLSFLFIYHHGYVYPGKKSNHKGIFFNLEHSVIISSKRIKFQVVSLSGYGMLTYISTLFSHLFWVWLFTDRCNAELMKFHGTIQMSFALCETPGKNASSSVEKPKFTPVCWDYASIKPYILKRCCWLSVSSKNYCHMQVSVIHLCTFASLKGII